MTMPIQIVFFALGLGTLVLIALSHKWCLPYLISARLITISTLVTAGIALCTAGITVNPIVLGLAVPSCQIVFFAGVILILFYRDPNRTPPNEPNIVVSPADGKIIYVRKLEPGMVFKCEKHKVAMRLEELENSNLARRELWQIGIAMRISDVHVNRAPIAGRVGMIYHRPGEFLSLRRDEAVCHNERQTFVIEGNSVQVGIVQIASRLVRRIEAYVQPEDTVEMGQRIGIIKFGSQVDLFVPAEPCYSPDVTVGHCLVAGETVMFRLR